MLRIPCYFNPRTRVECDVICSISSLRWTIFQSTHSCRVRRFSRESVDGIDYFNPRTRVECDLLFQILNSDYKYFNPRTRVECDERQLWSIALLLDFNPRTRVECDAELELAIKRKEDFNPRTRVECDICQPAVIFDYITISIHALV